MNGDPVEPPFDKDADKLREQLLSDMKMRYVSEDNQSFEE